MMSCPEHRCPSADHDRDDGPKPDWLRLSDGRPWRLARGTDFDQGVPTFVESARKAAEMMGRAVVVVGDRLDPDRYVWLQFADGEVEAGAPCPCGSSRLIRMASTFLKCEACRRVLLEQKRRTRSKKPAGTNAPEAELELEGEARVDDFTAVRLARAERTSERELLVGFGLDEHGRHALLVVTAPLVHGMPVPDQSSRIGIIHAVTFVLMDAVSSIERIDDTWDIVVE